MDVALRHVRQLEVDDVADRVDVDAARGDVGGDQGADLAGLELGQRAFALALALVAVDRGGVDAGLLQIAWPPCRRRAWCG